MTLQHRLYQHHARDTRQLTSPSRSYRTTSSLPVPPYFGAIQTPPRAPSPNVVSQTPPAPPTFASATSMDLSSPSPSLGSSVPPQTLRCRSSASPTARPPAASGFHLANAPTTGQSLLRDTSLCLAHVVYDLDVQTFGIGSTVFNSTGSKGH